MPTITPNVTWTTISKRPESLKKSDYPCFAHLTGVDH